MCSRKARRRCYFPRQILTFFREQKPIHNQQPASADLATLGENTVLLPTLLARKSSLPRHGDRGRQADFVGDAGRGSGSARAGGGTRQAGARAGAVAALVL